MVLGGGGENLKWEELGYWGHAFEASVTLECHTKVAKNVKRFLMGL